MIKKTLSRIFDFTCYVGGTLLFSISFFDFRYQLLPGEGGYYYYTHTHVLLLAIGLCLLALGFVIKSWRKPET